MVKEKFPELYKQFIENAHDLQKTLNTDMMNLVERYQNLDDMATIAAVSSKNINQEEPDKFLSVLEKVEEYVVNAITRFEKLDKLTGAEQTTKSVADLLHGTQYVNIRSMKNVSEAND